MRTKEQRMDVLVDHGAEFDTQGFLAACKSHNIDVVWPPRYGQAGQLRDLQRFVRLGELDVAATETDTDTGSGDRRPGGRLSKFWFSVRTRFSRSSGGPGSRRSSSADPSGAA
jgi:hypothetical protein